MQPKMIVKTDASIHPSKGVGLGYVATIYDEHGKYEKSKGSRYIPTNLKTTDAETYATAFGIKEVFDFFEEERDKYELVVETDCEFAVREVGDEIDEDDELERTMRYLCEYFKNAQIRWVSREENRKADAIAKSALDRGWEEQ